MGDLVIQIQKATDLPDFHLFHDAAPYVEIHVGSHKSKTKHVKHGKENPVWNEEIRVPYNDGMKGMSIVFKIKEHKLIESDKFIAQVTVPVLMFEQQQRTEQAFDLLNSKDEPSRGKLYLGVLNERWQAPQQQQQQQQAPPPQQQAPPPQQYQQPPPQQYQQPPPQQYQQPPPQQSQNALLQQELQQEAIINQQLAAEVQALEMNQQQQQHHHHHHHHHHHYHDYGYGGGYGGYHGYNPNFFPTSPGYNVNPYGTNTYNNYPYSQYNNPYPQYNTNPYPQYNTNPYPQYNTNPYSQYNTNPYPQYNTNPYSQYNTNPYSQYNNHPFYPNSKGF